MWNLQEYIDPYDESNPDWWIKVEHLARYQFVEYYCNANYGQIRHALDASCGCGYGTKILSDISDSVLGIDYSSDTLEVARSKYNADNIEYKQIDLEKIKETEQKLHRSKFDIITSFETIEHLSNPYETLDMLASRLKGNGLLLLSFPDPRLEKVDEKGDPKNEHHKSVIDIDSVTEQLESNGIKIQGIYSQPDIYKYYQLEMKQSKLKQRVPRSSELPELHNPAVVEKIARTIGWPEQDSDRLSYSKIVIAKLIN